MQRFRDSQERYSPYDLQSLLDIAIAFEAVFLNDTDNAQELNYRLATRVARFLGKDKETRIKVFDLVRNLYAFRSKLAHGITFDDLKETEARKLKEVHELALIVLRVALRKFLEGQGPQGLKRHEIADWWKQLELGDYIFEEKTISQANIDDIEVELYKKYHELRQLGPLDESLLPIADLLVNLKIAGREEGKILPTVVGLLMFGKHPQKYLPNAALDCAIYSGSVPDSICLINATPCTGTVPEQIVRAVEFVKRYMEVPAQKTEAGRQDLPQYSLRAVHEAIVNAVAHRDYLIAGSSIRLFMFDDRLEITSPGRLPNTVTIESLYAGAIPYRRNQILVGFLKDYASPITMRAFMESRGEGVLLIIRESEKISGRRPLYEEIGEAVKITIYGRSKPNRPQLTGEPYRRS